MSFFIWDMDDPDFDRILGFVKCGDEILEKRRRLRDGDTEKNLAGKHWLCTIDFEKLGARVSELLRQKKVSTEIVHKVVHAAQHTERSEMLFEKSWFDAKAFLMSIRDSQEGQSINIIDKVLSDFLPIWKTRKSYADAGKRMDEALSDEDYDAYKSAKPGRRITQGKREHFTKLAKNWKEQGLPENLK